MTDKHVQSEAPHSNMEKDPNDWVTGDEPMTGAQKSYLKTLSEEAKVDFDESLNKADASKRIDELQHTTGRGAGGHETRHEPEPAARSSHPAAHAAAPRRAAPADDASEAGEEDPGSDERDLFEADTAPGEARR